jgi:hypothetical protein
MKAMRLPLISRNFFGANGLLLSLILSLLRLRFAIERKLLKICTSVLILSQEPPSSAAAELRRSLNQKRGDTFLCICAARHIREALCRAVGQMNQPGLRAVLLGRRPSVWPISISTSGGIFN